MNTAAGMMVRTYVTFRVSLEVMEKQAEEEGDSLFLPVFCLWAPSSGGSSFFPQVSACRLCDYRLQLELDPL